MYALIHAGRAVLYVYVTDAHAAGFLFYCMRLIQCAENFVASSEWVVIGLGRVAFDRLPSVVRTSVCIYPHIISIDHWVPTASLFVYEVFQSI